MRHANLNKIKAFSLVEILLAISLFVGMITVTGSLVLEGVRAVKNQSIRVTATYKIKEIYNAVNIAKEDLWLAIVENSGTGAKHIEFVDGKYTIVDAPVADEGLTISFTIDPVRRDTDGNIVAEGGIEDEHTRSILTTATWLDIAGQTNELISRIYLTDWNTAEWLMSSQADFNAGEFDFTMTKADADGEIVLASVFYPDWCKPDIQNHKYDIPGNAYARTVFGEYGRAFFGTGGNASGDAYTEVSITGVESPTIAVRDIYNKDKVTDIFVQGNFSYLVTNKSNEDIQILNTTNVPSVKVGYYNTPTNKLGASVWVNGTTGYVAAGQYVYAFDLTSNTGSRTTVGSKQIALNSNYGSTSSVGKIVIRGNYLYASLLNDWYELVIVDITNPANMQIVSQSSVNNQQPRPFYVSENGNRVYFTTSPSTTEPEMFVIDTSVKSGARPIIGTYDSGGMLINGISVIEEDERIIMVGNSGMRYQAIRLDDETQPELCGTYDFPYEIFDVVTVRDPEGNAYSYVVTASATEDFQIFRGGIGGTGYGNGWGVPREGSYTSPVFDTTSSLVKYYNFDLGLLENQYTEIKFQARAGDTADLSTLPWVGPDGTTATFFTSSGENSFGASFQRKRYIQYKGFFISDTYTSPEIEDTMITYQR